ncbi:hypothetical protein C2845_PM16G00130 [Panicum miliaceum]|uniref:Uncharacterized protein n=1 Tax=Panicum miliaceum TaxID=4540 RepID=A0A3L6PVT9_PANMI|nr:hypothetical protein C2845_PM16G00130 [Panicum miliaceum]
MSCAAITQREGDEDRAEAVGDWPRLPADMLRLCPGQFRRGTPVFYFHDDDSFKMTEMIAYGSNGRMYPCHDNGWWWRVGGQIRRVSDQNPPSSCTPPVWYFR